MSRIFGENFKKNHMMLFELLPFFSSPVQSTGRAIVVTLAPALALPLALPLMLPFPSRHF